MLDVTIDKIIQVVPCEILVSIHEQSVGGCWSLGVWSLFEAIEVVRKGPNNHQLNVPKQICDCCSGRSVRVLGAPSVKTLTWILYPLPGACAPNNPFSEQDIIYPAILGLQISTEG